MPFSSIAYERGNRISTAGSAILCNVAQQVELRQTVPAVLTLPAAQSPAGPFIPTVVACPKVLQDSVIYLEGSLFFYTRQAWLIPGTARVQCGALTAEAVVTPGPDAVTVAWVLRGVFIVQDQTGQFPVTAQTRPMLQAFGTESGSVGTWQATIAATCLGCAIVLPPRAGSMSGLGFPAGRLYGPRRQGRPGRHGTRTARLSAHGPCRGS